MIFILKSWNDTTVFNRVRKLHENFKTFYIKKSWVKKNFEESFQKLKITNHSVIRRFFSKNVNYVLNLLQMNIKLLMNLSPNDAYVSLIQNQSLSLPLEYILAIYPYFSNIFQKFQIHFTDAKVLFSYFCRTHSKVFNLI